LYSCFSGIREIFGEAALPALEGGVTSTEDWLVRTSCVGRFPPVVGACGGNAAFLAGLDASSCAGDMAGAALSLRKHW
jgi:hypothetical protein